MAIRSQRIAEAIPAWVLRNIQAIKGDAERAQAMAMAASASHANSVHVVLEDASVGLRAVERGMMAKYRASGVTLDGDSMSWGIRGRVGIGRHGIGLTKDVHSRATSGLLGARRRRSGRPRSGSQSSAIDISATVSSGGKASRLQDRSRATRGARRTLSRPPVSSVETGLKPGQETWMGLPKVRAEFSRRLWSTAVWEALRANQGLQDSAGAENSSPAAAAGPRSQAGLADSTSALVQIPAWMRNFACTGAMHGVRMRQNGLGLG